MHYTVLPQQGQQALVTLPTIAVMQGAETSIPYS